MKTLGVLLLVVLGGVAYYHFFYAPRRKRPQGEKAYVMPESLPVVDTTAVIRNVIATLHAGQAVLVTERVGDWAQVALGDGRTGWVGQKYLLDAATHGEGEVLLRQVAEMQPQATGHTNDSVNLHLAPSRSARKIMEFAANQPVEVYDRRVVSRPHSQASSQVINDVWYLVRGGGDAGWMLGRFVDLDIPPGLSNYAQGINMVAWLVLDTVNDGGRQVPQYVAADRIGAEDVDFNHIRVFTWWVKHHKYVTAYVESNLEGYFPITVTHVGGVPYFRLRLVDDKGDKFQKVYGLFDTIVRTIGTVGGWTSTVMPQPRPRGGGLRRQAAVMSH